MLRKYLTWSQSRHQITLPSALVWSCPGTPPTALSSVLPPCSHIWSIWSTCPWHVLPEPLGLSSRSSCEYLLTHQPFPERNRGATVYRSLPLFSQSSSRVFTPTHLGSTLCQANSRSWGIWETPLMPRISWRKSIRPANRGTGCYLSLLETQPLAFS